MPEPSSPGAWLTPSHYARRTGAVIDGQPVWVLVCRDSAGRQWGIWLAWGETAETLREAKLLREMATELYDDRETQRCADLVAEALEVVVGGS